MTSGDQHMFMMYKSHKSFSNSVGQSATYSKNITSVRKKGKAIRDQMSIRIGNFIDFCVRL